MLGLSAAYAPPAIWKNANAIAAQNAFNRLSNSILRDRREESPVRALDQINEDFLNDVIQPDLERERSVQSLVTDDGPGNISLDLIKPSKPVARVLDG